MTFGEAIIKLRSERRISQRQLAEELNVSFTSVNRWENGRTMPNKMTVFVIRKYCEEHGLDFSFDRKSARIDAKTLAIHLIAFANADGGMIAVGVEDDGTITGIDGHAEHINELLRAPFDFCKPSVRVETERLSCVNRTERPTTSC